MEAAAGRAEASEQLRVKRETLQAVLHQCQRALELLRNADDEDENAANSGESAVVVTDEEMEEGMSSSLSSSVADAEADALCDLLKFRVESSNFLEKLGSIQMSTSHAMISSEDGSTWDVVSERDLWEGGLVGGGQADSDQEDYVLVRQEDIVEGIACFMAAYLLSLKQTKELTPNQLQDALSKTFSVKKKKGKLRKAWDGSKVIYNVASWGATAIGIYQNPALFRAASVAFWTSCRVLSKLL